MVGLVKQPYPLLTVAMLSCFPPFTPRPGKLIYHPHDQLVAESANRLQDVSAGLWITTRNGDATFMTHGSKFTAQVVEINLRGQGVDYSHLFQAWLLEFKGWNSYTQTWLHLLSEVLLNFKANMKEMVELLSNFVKAQVLTMFYVCNGRLLLWRLP